VIRLNYAEPGHQVPAIPPYCFILEKYIKPANSFPAATTSYT